MRCSSDSTAFVLCVGPCEIGVYTGPPLSGSVDSLVPTRSALSGPLPRANSFLRFPTGSSLRSGGERVKAFSECQKAR